MTDQPIIPPPPVTTRLKRKNLWVGLVGAVWTYVQVADPTLPLLVWNMMPQDLRELIVPRTFGLIVSATLFTAVVLYSFFRKDKPHA